MERKKIEYSDMRWNGYEWEIHMGYPLGHVSLNDELHRLQSENAELKARMSKAVEFAIYVNNQFGYCMPNEFFDKYYGLMGEPPKE